MKIFFGTDHAGFELKSRLIPFVKGLGFEVFDKGAYEYNKDDDYPDFIIPVAKEVSADSKNSRGIIIGGSGQGEAMTASRFPGIRAVVYYGESAPVPSGEEPSVLTSIIKMSREHNDSNILSLGARFITEEEAKVAVKIWLETPFSGEEKHKRRIEKINKAIWGSYISGSE
ncbi:MAG: ribose-5-phosphate isomerase ribose 5-phosphate isomerase [Parcubacteria group bacterium]|nr:ribose-5-phosphate isomerase ribose 5-phosphate isomerase [Parcubacteria group bacterium]